MQRDEVRRLVGTDWALCLAKGFASMAPKMNTRRAAIHRATNETRIAVTLNIDGTGKSSIKTGIPFFDHMLTLFAKHAVVDLQLRCEGDLEVDAHHTVEDCGIALGRLLCRRWATKRAFAATAPVLIPETPSPAKPMCRWTNAWRGASLISAAGPTWSGAGLNEFAYKNVSKAERKPGHVQRVPLRPGP